VNALGREARRLRGVEVGEALDRVGPGSAPAEGGLVLYADFGRCAVFAGRCGFTFAAFAFGLSAGGFFTDLPFATVCPFFG